MVASRPSSVSVIRSAAPCLASSSSTSAGSAAKCAGIYMLPRLGLESRGKAAPYGVVILLAVTGPHGLLSGHDHPPALEHEGQRAVDLLRAQLCLSGPAQRL